MNCLVIGAGNGSRPVARLLNHDGYDVTMTDVKDFEDFRLLHQNVLSEMEMEGVKLDLGNSSPKLSDFENIYIPPSLINSKIGDEARELDIHIINNEEFSQIVNKYIPIDVIGISGTMGKTTTTYLTKSIFEQAGYNVWYCSSLISNLVSECIIEGIVKGEPLKNDLAIFELPHGTIGLLDRLNVDIGLLTNMGIDHLDEFDNSVEKYHDRKKILEMISKTFIANYSCKDTFSSKDDILYYEIGNNGDFNGEIGERSLKIRHQDNEFTTSFDMESYFFENSVAAVSIALTYGISQEDIIEALSNFKGMPSHMEDIGMFNDRRVILDCAFLYDGMKTTLENFNDENLIVFLDYFDTTTKRDKKEVGELVGKYSDVIITSGYDEINERINMEGALEILDAVENPNATKVACSDIDEAAEMALKYSKPGDLLLHMGPILATDPKGITDKIIKGLKRGIEKYD